MVDSEKYLIVIVNYANWKYTSECVQSLLEADVQKKSILIIDNASPNESYLHLNKLFPKIEIIRNSENIGFAAANNIGIKSALAKNLAYIIFLNNDTFVEKHTISNLLKEMENRPDVTIGTGRIFFYPSRTKLWYDGGKLVNWRGLAIHNNYQKDIFSVRDYKKTQFVSFISGCYMCVRLSDIEALGFWEERFFLYLEDIEYCARAKNKNMKMIFVPNSIIYHKVGERDSYNSMVIYYSIRNRLLLIKLAFPSIAKLYFYSVILSKGIYWRIINPKRFSLLKRALIDYKNKYYYEFVEQKSNKH